METKTGPFTNTVVDTRITHKIGVPHDTAPAKLVLKSPPLTNEHITVSWPDHMLGTLDDTPLNMDDISISTEELIARFAKPTSPAKVTAQLTEACSNHNKAPNKTRRPIAGHRA
jgi:hypothetical protein